MKTEEQYSLKRYLFLQEVWLRLEELDFDNEIFQTEKKREIMKLLGIKERTKLVSVPSDYLLRARKKILKYLGRHRGEFERDEENKRFFSGEQRVFEFRNSINLEQVCLSSEMEWREAYGNRDESF